MARWLLLTMLVLTGCQRGSAAGGSSTTESPTTIAEEPTTTTSPTSFEVPAIIDLSYVQRVLEAIYHLDGEATRHIYANKLPDAEFEARLRAIFAGQALDESKRILQENAAEGFARLADPPGDAEVRAVKIIQSTPNCIVVRADLDYDPQYKGSRRPEPQAVIHMVRFEVLTLNPTGWGVLSAGDPEPGQNLEVCP